MIVVIEGLNNSYAVKMKLQLPLLPQLRKLGLNLNTATWQIEAITKNGSTLRTDFDCMKNTVYYAISRMRAIQLSDVDHVRLTPYSQSLRSTLDTQIDELVATRRMQATNPPDNPAKPTEESSSQPNEQSCSQPKGTDTMSQVNASIPVQTVTYIYGHNIDHMGKSELFNAARAVAAEIEGLKKANESVGSVAIAQQIVGLEKDLNNIRGLLDSKYATQSAAETAAE